MNYEKQFKPKKKIHKWQVISLVIVGIIFVVATIIFIVLWYKNIFSENVLAICLIILFIIFGLIGALISYKMWKSNE